MGYAGNLEYKQKAQDLRRKGLSYNEIRRTIPVPKSTLSGWCRDITLTEKQALRLFKNKLTCSARGRIIGAKRQQAKRIAEISELLQKGESEVGKLSKRDRFIAGIALYAAEGTKEDKACSFTNSDPVLINFMNNWFKEFCFISQDKVRGAIWIHEGLDENKAKNFWSKLVNIPMNQFHKTYIARNKSESRKVRKNIHKYGVFSLRFSDAKIHRKIMGWISGILKSKLL